MRQALLVALLLTIGALACGPLGGASEQAVQTAIAQTEAADARLQAAVGTAVAATAGPSVPTATPDLSPTPTERADTEPVYVRSHTEVNDGEQRYVIGEVANDGPLDVEFVKVTADFFDADGDPAGSQFAYTRLNMIPAGGRSPFSLPTYVSEDVSPDWVTYQLSVDWQAVRSECAECYVDFEVLGDTLNTAGGRVRMEGLVANVGSSDAGRVQVVVAYYDAADEIVGTGFTFADQDVVPAGGASPFSIVLYVGLPVAIDHYALYVEGTAH